MLYAIISIVLGTIAFLVMAFILWPIYVEIRGLIRGLLYQIGVDTYTKEEKIYLGWLKPDEIAPPVGLQAEVVSNCILSKSNFPNIEKYVSNYQEFQVVRQEPESKEVVVKEEFPNPFLGMTYKRQQKIVEMLLEKNKHGKLDSMEEAMLKVLSDPENMEKARLTDSLIKKINNY